MGKSKHHLTLWVFAGGLQVRGVFFGLLLVRILLPLVLVFQMSCTTQVHARLGSVPVGGLSPWLSEVKDIRVTPYNGGFFQSNGLMMFDTPSLSENFHEELQRGIAKALVETGGRVGMKNADDLVVEIENCSLIWESYMGIRSRAHVCIVATKGHGPSKRFARVEGVADEGSAMVRMASTAEPQLTRAIDKCIAELVRSTPLQDSRNESPTPGVTTGTCFAVASDGWLVTAEHVIKDKVSLEVQIGSAAVAATVVARDHEGDLALLRVGVPTPDFLVIDPIWKTEIGKEVYSLGFPAVGFLSQDIRYNNGTVSAERALEGNLHLFQISVPAQPGNSGGPLLSKTSGGLVGVIVSKASVKAFLSAMGTLPEGITFAVQAQRVQSLLAAAQIRPGLATETDVDHARKATFLIICK